jgi:hypothetical protein
MLISLPRRSAALAVVVKKRSAFRRGCSATAWTTFPLASLPHVGFDVARFEPLVASKLVHRLLAKPIDPVALRIELEAGPKSN